MLRLLFLVMFLLVIVSCGNETQKKQVQNKQKKKEIRLKIVDSTHNNYAKIMSGNELSLLTYHFYDKYSEELHQKADKIDQDRFKPMKKWNREQMGKSKQSSKSLFYPFSGGDFLHANTYFPDVDTYILMAKEKVGSVPILNVSNSGKFKQHLTDITKSLRDLFGKSYFITKHMNTDTRKTTVNGMLPILLFSLGLREYQIIDIYDVKIDSSGSLKTSDFNNDLKSNAIKIDFFEKNSTTIKSLYYFSCDLSNDGLENDKNLAKYIESLPKGYVFLKSASYLLHYGTFSTIRNLIINNLKYLIQDDTGIPFKKFNPSNFDVKLFGKYTKPVKDFSNGIQLDMSRAYKSDLYKGGLPFSLGYHWFTDNQNQQIIIKK